MKPKINTSYRSHGKWGDFLACIIPTIWCFNILVNSSFILRLVEWQNEASLFTVRIRGRQWYWIYKFELRNVIDLMSVPKNIGWNKWIIQTGNSIEIADDYYYALKLRAQNEWLLDCWEKSSKTLKKYIKTNDALFLDGIYTTLPNKKIQMLDSDNYYITGSQPQILEKTLNDNFLSFFKKKKLKFKWMENFYVDNSTNLNFYLQKIFSRKLWARKYYKNFSSKSVASNHIVLGSVINKKAFLLKKKIKNLIFEYEYFLKNQAYFEKEVPFLNLNNKKVHLHDTTRLSKKRMFQKMPILITKNYIYLHDIETIKNQTVNKKKTKVSVAVKAINYLNKNSIDYLLKLKASQKKKHKNIYEYFFEKIKTVSFLKQKKVIPVPVVKKKNFFSYFASLFFRKKKKSIAPGLSKVDPVFFEKITKGGLNANFNTTRTIERKMLSDAYYLVLRQKRYKRKKSINSRIIGKYNMQTKDVVKTTTETDKPYLFSNQIIKSLDFDPNALYRLIKKNKTKTETFSVQLSRRLLRTKKTLVLPAHANITLISNSYDVIHSWFIPALGIKIDCVPGRATHHTFFCDSTGFYYGQCAEICGRYHHHMPIRLCVVPFEHFLIWWTHFGLPKLLYTLPKKKIETDYGIKKFVW
uniref:cytochrome c oxidase subunit 2 n=1 Tax=Paramecium gigas TaxID=2709424 RepID=UPI001D02FB2F|nr:cytochrome c oxidase subunit 2 [Paramecium gigas]QVG61505.1 cytochrome c oxidase subunit 2 [Paramecium gigas]